MRNVGKLKTYLEAMMSDENKVEKIVTVAAGIIVKEGDNGEKKVLLIQRAADDHWPLHFEFPRGKCDKGDGNDPRKCAVREIKEETGLDVEIVSFLGKFVYYADKGKRKSICYNYECSMKNPNQNVKLSHEHDGYKWITQAGEAEMLVHPDQKRFIQQVLSQNNPIVNEPENNFTKNNKLDEYLDRVK
jgi:mutator protein MutT